MQIKNPDGGWKNYRVLKMKRDAMKVWETERLKEYSVEFRSANKWAKKTVARVNACPLDALYSELKTLEGKKYIK